MNVPKVMQKAMLTASVKKTAQSRPARHRKNAEWITRQTKPAAMLVKMNTILVLTAEVVILLTSVTVTQRRALFQAARKNVHVIRRTKEKNATLAMTDIS